MLLAAVLTLGTALLLPRLGVESLWLDESLTADAVVFATDARDVVRRTMALDSQPPGHHLLLYFITRFTPPTEFSLRLPSLVAVELGLLLLFFLIRGLWGPSIALGAVAAAQLSPFLAFYAIEVRNYGVWFLLLTGSLLLMVRWLRASGAAAHRTALAWGMLNALGLWVHPFHAFLMVGQLAVVGVLYARPLQPARIASAVGAQLLAAALFAPWMWLLATAADRPVGVGWVRGFSLASGAYYLYAAHFGVSFGPTVKELHVEDLAQLAAAHSTALAVAALAICSSLAVYALLVRDGVRDRGARWELLVLVVFPVAALVGPLLFAAARGFPLHPRHLLFVWPLLPVVQALGWRRGGVARLAVAAVLLVQGVSLASFLIDARYAKDDHKGAIRFAEKHSGQPAYVLADGSVASLYCRVTAGRPKEFLDFPPGTRDVWLVDSRPWELGAQHREHLAERLAALGLGYENTYTQFRGIQLRHWTAARPTSGIEDDGRDG